MTVLFRVGREAVSVVFTCGGKTFALWWVCFFAAVAYEPVDNLLLQYRNRPP